ncbi:hypothetical protein L873DRAFT_1856023, partial [Choiromyces venosus 120613-1]
MSTWNSILLILPTGASASSKIDNLNFAIRLSDKAMYFIYHLSNILLRPNSPFTQFFGTELGIQNCRTGIVGCLIVLKSLISDSGPYSIKELDNRELTIL